MTRLVVNNGEYMRQLILDSFEAELPGACGLGLYGEDG